MHGEAAQWSVTDHLLAAAVDHLAAANWMFLSVNSEEGDQPDPPEPIPRPSLPGEDDEDDEDGSGTGKRDDEVVSPSALARFFG
ncbi:hypothetical protein ACIRSU_23505 [Streptomyces sp. NPDC101160]|uniref:hypothetical protein n=1 Tax=Streptomyces sp. NPDC101160 TaxID=3366118 RepID=UPI003821A645